MKLWNIWAWSKHRSSPEVFCEKGVFKSFTKFTGKHPYQSFFFYKVARLRPATLLKQRLWHRCLPVNCVKFLRRLFLWNSSGGCFWKHNVTMQTTAEFASNSTANIKLSKRPSFLLLTSNKFITKIAMVDFAML